jgi:hypothetical protein
VALVQGSRQPQAHEFVWKLGIPPRHRWRGSNAACVLKI